MGKKTGKQGVNIAVPPSLPQKELYQRVNFALQSSAFLQKLGESSGIAKGKRRAISRESGPADEQNNHAAQIEESDEGTMSELARVQMRTTKKMAAHTQLKLYGNISTPLVLITETQA